MLFWSFRLGALPNRLSQGPDHPFLQNTYTPPPQKMTVARTRTEKQNTGKKTTGKPAWRTTAAWFARVVVRRFAPEGRRYPPSAGPRAPGIGRWRWMREQGVARRVRDVRKRKVMNGTGTQKMLRYDELYQHPTLQVSEMVAFGDLKVAGGDLLEGAGI